MDKGAEARRVMIDAVGGMCCCRLLYQKRECYLVHQFGKDVGTDFCKSRSEDEDFWNAGIPNVL
jgi:hypothetical protein